VHFLGVEGPGLAPFGPAPAHWSPYTAPDLCGFPSGDWGLGAAHPRNGPL
jgi:hypothetical protein